MANEQDVKKEDVETIVEEAVNEAVTEAIEEGEQLSETELLQQQLEAEKDAHLRLRADFENFRKRVILDREAAEKYKNQQILQELLPVIDNFERALQVEVTSEDAASLKKGIEMVYQLLNHVATNAGLEAIQSEGQPFDAFLHQPMMTEQVDGQEAGIVLQELQKGYRLKDRVIRPAMVKVSE